MEKGENVPKERQADINQEISTASSDQVDTYRWY
jgi:hypothetical protein